MWKLDHKEGWAPKNWCLQIMVLGKTLESPLDCKETKPVNSKGNLSWILIERTDDKAEAPILWSLMWRADLLGKTLMLGKTESKKRRGQQRMRWLESITDSMDMNLSKLWGRADDRGAWPAAVHSVTESGLSNWTITRNHAGLWSKKLFLIHIY